MKGVMLFSGQGNLKIKSLKWLCQRLPEVKHFILNASDLLKHDISYMFDASGLHNTQYQQLVVCIIAAAYIKHFEKLNISIAAGHSLGELIACYKLKVISFEDLILIVSERGKIMQKIANQCKGGMLIIFSNELSMINTIYEEQFSDRISLANVNSDTQALYSGLISELTEFETVIKKNRTCVSRWLDVNGPWHSSYMLPIVNTYKIILERHHFNQPDGKLYMSFPSIPSHNPNQIRNNLANQLATTVYWSKLIRAIVKTEHPDFFFEIGHGSALKGLHKHICPHIPIYSAGDKKNIQKLLLMPS